MVKKCADVSSTWEVILFKNDTLWWNDIYPLHINKNLPIKQRGVEREPFVKIYSLLKHAFKYQQLCNHYKTFVFIHEENSIVLNTSFIHSLNKHSQNSHSAPGTLLSPGATVVNRQIHFLTLQSLNFISQLLKWRMPQKGK